jgi:hypothetical protein
MTILEIALGYIARGWSPVPIPYRKKGPLGAKWQKLRIDATTAPKHFNGGPQNVGVQMGEASGGLIDSDLDCAEAIEIAPYFLPKTNAIFGRTSSRNSHWLYVSDLHTTTDKAVFTFEDPTRKADAMLLELRIGGGGAGAQTVFPGSVHEEGEDIKWEVDGEPAKVDGTRLHRVVRQIAAYSLLVRYWPPAGSHTRHHTGLVMGGFLSRAGMAKDRVSFAVEVIARAAGDEEWKDRRKAAEDATTADRKCGLTRMREIFGEAVANKVAEWLDYGGDDHEQPGGTRGAARAEDAHTWDNPDISLIDDRRGDLPEFPIEALPLNCQDWLRRAAHGAGVTPDHVAVPLLGVISSLIGTARRARASRSWSEPMTTWTTLVGFSGTGKTPGINVMKNALSVVVRNRGHEIDELRRQHETAVETAKAAHRQWKDKVSEALESGGKPPIKPVDADEPGPFVAPQLYVSDATIERLGMLLTARPQGMLLLADELAGLFSNMSRYSGGQDNEFWLECWNGSAYVIERMNRPPLRVPHLLIGISGGIQPDKLEESFAGAADGMYARFLFSWPVEAPYRPLTDAVSEVEPEILNALERLSRLGGSKTIDFAPGYVPLSAAARAEFEGFRKRISDGKELVYGRERDWWSKMSGHALRLAGVLAFLDWSMGGPSPEPTEIKEEFMKNAVLLINGYFYPHSRAALRQIGLSDCDADARRVLHWLKASGLAQASREDIRRDALGQRINAGATQGLIDRLVASGWLRLLPGKPKSPEGGRPAKLWEVNPVLWSQR